MMGETIFEASQDYGMSNGVLPQWKRELLQRRAARSRPTASPPPPGVAPPPPPPPPPPAHDDDEELRYGPGIVKRLKSRYLSLALRDAPRRRPSVLRRAASLEHMLDERPPPAPRPAARPPRPASVALAPPAAARRDCVKRARSVDALSRLDARDEPAPPPSPPPPRAPPAPRAARPPRRPAPLLRDAERPPPDVVRSTLRKFESAPPRRAAPAARVSAVLRGLDAGRRAATPDRAEPEAGLDEEAPPPTSPPPPPPATPAPVPRAIPPPVPPPVTPPPVVPPVTPPPVAPPATLPPVFPEASSAPASKPPAEPSPPRSPRPETPSEECAAVEAEGGAARVVSRAALEGIARAGCTVRFAFGARVSGSHLPPLAATNALVAGAGGRRVGVIRPMPAARPRPASPPPTPRPLARAGGRAPPAAATTSVVFNFSDRKEVPDYIENDGIILRTSRRNRIKAGESGVVVLRAADAGSDSESDEAADAADGGGACVRFLNDNVLINGRSSLRPAAPDHHRLANLKLQFDESLTVTFEYPSESSFSEDPPSPAPSPAPPAASPAPPAPSAMHDNTHIASAALSRYTPHKTAAAAFQLGVCPSPAPAPAAPAPAPAPAEEGGACAADVARCWSEARTLHTDLLF